MAEIKYTWDEFIKQLHQLEVADGEKEFALSEDFDQKRLDLLAATFHLHDSKGEFELIKEGQKIKAKRTS